LIVAPLSKRVIAFSIDEAVSVTLFVASRVCLFRDVVGFWGVPAASWLSTAAKSPFGIMAEETGVGSGGISPPWLAISESSSAKFCLC